MSSRAAAKERARAARKESERSAAEAEHRRRRLVQLGIVLLAAALIVGALIIVSQAGDDSGGPVEGGAEAAALFAGIPQSGNVLGDANAPGVMVEFADLQCPFCAQYAGDVLPDVVRRYVRPGGVRLELDVISRIGPDSERGARAAVAAGLQDKMWQFADVFYAQPGDRELRLRRRRIHPRRCRAGSGPRRSRVLADMDSAAVDRRLARYERTGAAARYRGDADVLRGAP